MTTYWFEKFHVGDVYYIPHKHKFVQVRGIDFKEDKVFCGGYCNYYGDAFTCIDIQKIFPDAFSEAIKINDIDHPQYFSIVEHDEIGYKVREK